MSERCMYCKNWKPSIIDGNISEKKNSIFAVASTCKVNNLFVNPFENCNQYNFTCKGFTQREDDITEEEFSIINFLMDNKMHTAKNEADTQ